MDRVTNSNMERTNSSRTKPLVISKTYSQVHSVTLTRLTLVNLPQVPKTQRLRSKLIYQKAMIGERHSQNAFNPLQISELTRTVVHHSSWPP